MSLARWQWLIARTVPRLARFCIYKSRSFPLVTRGYPRIHCESMYRGRLIGSADVHSMSSSGPLLLFRD